MATASRKFQNLRPPKVAVGLFSAAIAVLLITAQCSSSEESVEDPATTASVAESTPSTVSAPTSVPASISTTANASTSSTTSVLAGPTATVSEKPEEEQAEESSETQEESVETGEGQESQSALLRSFEQCSELFDHIQENALERIGPNGLEGYDVGARFVVRDGKVEEISWLGDTAEISSPPGVSARPAIYVPYNSSDFSSHAQGVEEADIISTNGRQIIGLVDQDYRSELWVVDVSDRTPRLIANLVVPNGDYREFYLSGDRLFVIGRSWVGIDPPEGEGVVADRSRGGIRLPGSIYDKDAVVITELSISDPGNLEIIRHLRVEGRYVKSHLADGYIRVVISSMPDKVGLVKPSSEDSEVSAERFNRQLVQESTLDQWLPDYNLHDADGESISRGRLVDCDRIYVPSEFSGFNQVSVLSFATDETLSLNDSVSTMMDGETVYASPSNLYLSRTVFDNDVDNKLETVETAIYKFLLVPAGKAAPEASGTMVGLPINGNAFHEYDGHLFVTATMDDTEGFVAVLEDTGSTLTRVATIDNIGRDERIFAVRYIDDKAYAMTYDNTDPLYVIDLADPSNPAIGGELQISGETSIFFGSSTYLHPVGENLLLGVGREVSATDRESGARVGLFEVSDPANPKTLDSLDLEDVSAENGQAFLWIAPKNLAVVPMGRRSKNFALGLRVDTEADSPEIEIVSRVIQDPELLPTGDKEGCRWFEVPSTSLSWTAEKLNTVAVVIICPTNPECDFFCNPDNYYACSGELQKPGEQNFSSTPRATIDEIIGEVRTAMTKSNSEELNTLLATLQSPFVEDASQIEICYPGGVYDWDSVWRPEILRSLVIDDNLWTISSSYIQANDLEFFDRLAWLEMPGRPYWW